ncbi:hypothetical protein [Helicobacter equorum]|uniref:Uncharacterized protein n=1 Tax=Helicobacter equorum TaxID=361872 RepID=A0A3D8IS61_9HELI|nr:hypothetical protein [Helicobacter equorum]RDU67421.1 hypothetical protein CQA54_05490 [Helicobacter equorum]
MLNWFLDIGIVFVLLFMLGLWIFVVLVIPPKCFDKDILAWIMGLWLLLIPVITIAHFILSCSDNTRQMVSEVFSKKLNIPNEKAYNMLSYNIGLGICERNNFNGNTCIEYLKYVENKLLDCKNKDTEEKLNAEKERIKAEEEERLKIQAIEKAIWNL